MKLLLLLQPPATLQLSIMPYANSHIGAWASWGCVLKSEMATLLPEARVEPVCLIHCLQMHVLRLTLPD